MCNVSVLKYKESSPIDPSFYKSAYGIISYSPAGIITGYTRASKDDALAAIKANGLTRAYADEDGEVYDTRDKLFLQTFKTKGKVVGRIVRNRAHYN